MTQATGAIQKVGFIGLGLMGGPMAANVARAGYPLTVYNRSPEKLEPLLQLGAQAAASPKAVAEASEVVITMLSDAAAVEATVFAAGGAAGRRSPRDGPDQFQHHRPGSIAFHRRTPCRSSGVQMLDASGNGQHRSRRSRAADFPGRRRGKGARSLPVIAQQRWARIFITLDRAAAAPP